MTIKLSSDQLRAKQDLLSALPNASSETQWFGLFGGTGSGKTTLLEHLAGGALRSNAGRRLLLVRVDAANAPAYLRPWQVLLSQVLDRIGEFGLPSERDRIAPLRAEMLAIAAVDNEAAMATFVKHFRVGFGQLLQSVVSASQSTLVVALDHLDTANREVAGEIYESAQYFLNGPDLVLLVAGDEAALVNALDPVLLAPLAARINVGTASQLRGPEQPVPLRDREMDTGLDPRFLRAAPFALAGVGVLFLDQLSKLLMRNTPQPVSGLLRIGVPPGIDPSSLSAVVIELLVLVVALGIVLLNLRRSAADEPLAARLQSFGAALLAGAVLSNLLDRSIVGGVLTWMQIGMLPVFNLAHVAMAAGAVLVALSILRKQ